MESQNIDHATNLEGLKTDLPKTNNNSVSKSSEPIATVSPSLKSPSIKQLSSPLIIAQEPSRSSSAVALTGQIESSRFSFDMRVAEINSLKDLKSRKSTDDAAV